MSVEMILPGEFKDRMATITKIADDRERLRKAVKLMMITLRSMGYGEGCDIFQWMRMPRNSELHR